ncbi:MAG: prolyl hydroxylase family protein [Pseudohongiellaceae bacterium]
MTKLTLRKFYEIGQKVNNDPLVYVFENFLSNVEVEQLLAAAKPKLKQALVSDSEAGIESSGRTGRNCWVAFKHNRTIEDLSLRVAEVVGLPLDQAESLQVIHYGKTQQYSPHYDAWDAATERGRRCMVKGGQRLVTCLLYLNDVEEGGGTSFPNLDMEVRAKKGRMVLFHNCYQDKSIRHPDSLHGGMPVLEGEKWACNFWFRESQYQDLNKIPQRDENHSSPAKFSRVI